MAPLLDSATLDERISNPGTGGSALTFTSSDSTGYTLDCTLTPGAGGDYTGTVPSSCPGGPAGTALEYISGPATYVVLPGLARALRAPAPVREGELVDLQFFGQPADLAWLMFSPLAGSGFLPQFQGALLVPPTSPLVAVGTVSGTGTLVFSIPMPPLPPALQSLRLHLHSVYSPAAGSTLLGGGSDLIALDQAF